MKKIFLSITTLFFLTVLVNAQNSSPYWSLAGNSNASSSSKLGTTNGINLRFYTNNSERARVTTSGLFGIGTTSPTDKLHVNSASGTNPFRAQVAGSTKFLVHSNGNVGIGTISPSYKLHVAGNASISGGLYVGSGGIYGYGGSTNSLGVYGSGSSWGVYGTSPGIGVYGNSTASSYGVYGNSDYLGVYGNGTSYGLYGTASTSSGWGVYGSGSYGVYGSGSAYGVYASGGSIGVYGTGPTYGVYGFSSSARGVYGYSTNGIGGYFYSANSYGLWAATGRSDNYYAAVFDGNTYCYNSYLTSDKNLKQNVEEFSNALSIINKLKPKNYEFRHDGKFAALNLPVGRHYGLLAQELEEVLPNLVKEAPHQLNDLKPQAVEPTPNDGKMPTVTPVQNAVKGETINIKAVNYTELIPILVKAIQEQSAKIEELTILVAKLSQNTRSQPGVKFFGSLHEATPNPANNSSRITYSIPANTSRAELIINNAEGQKVKQIQLNKSGLVDINTSSLSSGTYFYSLIVDGRSVDTKKMVIAR